ncbi:MAG: hypothetical protein KatS3mg077_2190 [Candidatus Binatia bacterium]|nr:MAG: hypothetical protein KatS3mg077_2190 [Candidatus Binatia bacterium]
MTPVTSRPHANDTASVPSELVVEQHLRHAAVYRLLANALTPPTRELLDQIAAQATQVAQKVPEICDRARALAARAREADGGVLAGEYLRLFERESACSPREGTWNVRPVSGRPPLLADIAGFYHAFGVGLHEQFGDTEDHIAAELEFLSFLSLKLAYACACDHAEGTEIVRTAIQSFWRDHLGSFVVPFSRALEAATTQAFYRTTAQLLREWADQECERWGVACTAQAAPAPPSAVEADCLVCPLPFAEDR